GGRKRRRGPSRLSSGRKSAATSHFSLSNFTGLVRGVGKERLGIAPIEAAGGEGALTGERAQTHDADRHPLPSRALKVPMVRLSRRRTRLPRYLAISAAGISFKLAWLTSFVTCRARLTL